MTNFDELVAGAERAPIEGWDFSWLRGRAVEQRPSWRFFDRVVERTASISSLLEVQAGVGSMIETLPSLPELTSRTSIGMPFAERSFDLVISRHPVAVWWGELYRVLRPGGSYFAQHVGPHSLRPLSEFLMGPLPDDSLRDMNLERQAAERAGLAVHRMDLERPYVAFYDIGAVVYFLRLVPWTVPGFSVSKYRGALRSLHEVIQRDGVFETTASRTLVDATRPA